MVSVIPPLMLDAALEALEVRTKTLADGEPLQVCLSEWLTGEQGTNAVPTATLSADVAGAGRSIQSVAALGFRVATEKHEESHAVFIGGVDWLLGRADVTANVAAFAQPIVQLGLLVGLAEIDDQPHLNSFGAWLNRLAPVITAMDSGWRKELLVEIQSHFGAGYVKAPHRACNAASVALASKGLALLNPETVEAFEGVLIRRIRQLRHLDAEECAMDLVAFRYLAAGALDIDLAAPSDDAVLLVLSRLPSALRRWTWEEQKRTQNSTVQKWDVQNEYHFQNLLYAVLAPVFTDLRDEEWLQSVGPKKPRADLVIPSLKMLLEVKYWRANHRGEDLVSQIAEDVGLYLAKGSPYNSIIPIIWDDARRTEEHDYLKSGVSRMNGVRGVVLVARPHLMQ